MDSRNYFEIYLTFLKRMVTPLTFKHSLRVMQTMEELAEIYTLDPVRAMTAGLLHDVAKDLKPRQQLILAKKAGLTLHHDYEELPLYAHGPAGAYLVNKVLKISDPLITGAISAHTYAEQPADADEPLVWCLRFADVLAPLRQWTGMCRLKEIVYAGQMEKGALLLCGWLIEYFQACQIPIHLNLMDTFLSLALKLNICDDSFFARW